ncbi:MAG: hypothetical protein WBG41_14475 [Acidimicrobiales bacterium]
MGASRSRTRDRSLAVVRKYAVGLDGANACTPEDVGGSAGYGYCLEAVADPSHDEHKNYLDWVGGPFDPTSFNLSDVNAMLQKVR